MKRRRLGQHYLVDKEVVRQIVEFADIGESDRVLEIGTGKGALTKMLIGRGKSFEAFEVDEENYRVTLDEVTGGDAVFRLGDAFEMKPVFDVLVSSLPYSESATFVEWLAQLEYDRAVVLLQRDFVDKLLSPPGTRNYRGVSALAQISSDAHVLSRVSRNAFSPKPKVDSVIVRFTPKLRLGDQEIACIKRLFSLRRRRLSAALAKLGMGPSELGAKRVYSLSPAEVHAICVASSR